MSNRLQPRIRHQLTKDVGLGEQFRDAQKSLDRFPVEILRTVEMQYAEPMVLGGFSQPPRGIRVDRIIDMAAQETPVTACSGLVHYVWKPQQGGAVITNISGMTTAAHGGKTYRFEFRITFAPLGGR